MTIDDGHHLHRHHNDQHHHQDPKDCIVVRTARNQELHGRQALALVAGQLRL